MCVDRDTIILIYVIIIRLHTKCNTHTCVVVAGGCPMSNCPASALLHAEKSTINTMTVMGAGKLSIAVLTVGVGNTVTLATSNTVVRGVDAFLPCSCGGPCTKRPVEWCGRIGYIYDFVAMEDAHKKHLQGNSSYKETATTRKQLLQGNSSYKESAPTRKQLLHVQYHAL